MRNVHQEIDDFENLTMKVEDILECRVENVLQSITTTSLCDAPNEPITVDEFIKITDETIHKSTQLLAKYLNKNLIKIFFKFIL